MKHPSTFAISTVLPSQLSHSFFPFILISQPLFFLLFALLVFDPKLGYQM